MDQNVQFVLEEEQIKIIIEKKNFQKLLKDGTTQEMMIYLKMLFQVVILKDIGCVKIIIVMNL